MSFSSRPMTPADRLAVTLAGGRPDRIPVLPKIWLDGAAKLTSRSLRPLVEDPWLAMQSLIDAAVKVRADAVRLFLFPRRRTSIVDRQLHEVDEEGRSLGPIDFAAGWSTRLRDRSYVRIDDPNHVAFLQFLHGGPTVSGLADVRRIAVPDRSFYESAGYADLLRQGQRYAGRRVACVGDCDTGTLAWLVRFRGLQQGLIDLIDEPRLAHALIDRGVAYAIERGKLNLDAGLRVLRLNDSVANMSVVSPKLWEEYVYPYLKTICDELHAYCPEAKIYCHICGNVLPVIERLAETGLDAIGPLDPLGGFTVADARRAVGDRVVLMGGVDTLTLANASPGKVRAEARRCLEEGVRHGGSYVLASGCVVPPETPPENLVALGEAAEEFRQTV